MSRSVRQYGKQTKRSRAERLFAELPQSPVRKPPGGAAKVVANAAKVTEDNDGDGDDGVGDLAELVEKVKIDDGDEVVVVADPPPDSVAMEEVEVDQNGVGEPDKGEKTPVSQVQGSEDLEDTADESIATEGVEDGLRVLCWEDVCHFGDKIVKIAEASYAEVYRVTNPRGTSIIKVIRLKSPIRAQTKAQERSGLVDEEPHDEEDLLGELRISDWLADIPGFVVYKDRYIVQGKAPKALVETHQAFQRRVKRKDPDRLQFYPSPSRYLEGTKFLVVELGDAGMALEDFGLESVDQLWDVFLLVAIALARAEDLFLFEHRDLHEGNLCIRQVSSPKERDPSLPDVHFGYSGLDITILDYGLSRAEGYSMDEENEDDSNLETCTPVAYDLEKDLSLFTSTHADQCKVYRQMRSFLLRGDRKWMAVEDHTMPYALSFTGEPISWSASAPYTNVLWLAYIYEYIVGHFAGNKREVAKFKRTTKEMWRYLDPRARAGAPCFGSAGDVVRFAVEAGWLLEAHVVGETSTFIAEREDSIILGADGEGEDGTSRVRRSPRKRT